MSARKNTPQRDKLRIGERIRRIRTERGMTLASVAQHVGCSVALLSQIENDRVMPSVKTLTGIAAAMRVEPGAFFDEDDGGQVITFQRPGEREVIQTEDDLQLAEVLARARLDADREVAVYRFVLPPGYSEHGETHVHGGHELLYCIQGALEIKVGQERFVLEKGSSVHFFAGLPHTWGNASDEPVEFICVNLP